MEPCTIYTVTVYTPDKKKRSATIWRHPKQNPEQMP